MDLDGKVNPPLNRHQKIVKTSLVLISQQQLDISRTPQAAATNPPIHLGLRRLSLYFPGRPRGRPPSACRLPSLPSSGSRRWWRPTCRPDGPTARKEHPPFDESTPYLPIGVSSYRGTRPFLGCQGKILISMPTLEGISTSPYAAVVRGAAATLVALHNQTSSLGQIGIVSGVPERCRLS